MLLKHGGTLMPILKLPLLCFFPLIPDFEKAMHPGRDIVT
jgi:hypothetical protein